MKEDPVFRMMRDAVQQIADDFAVRIESIHVDWLELDSSKFVVKRLDIRALRLHGEQ